MEKSGQLKEELEEEVQGGRDTDEGDFAEPTMTTEKVDSLILALAKERKNSEECLNRLKYLQADFDNYRKRMERQIDEAKRRTAESIYADLLEVLDELELALSNGKASNSSPALMEGVEMTLKKLKKMMAAQGICEISCKGSAFDPKLHCAVSTEEDDNKVEGIVVEELRKGYTIDGRVLRPAMVKVSVRKSGSNHVEKEKKG